MPQDTGQQNYVTVGMPIHTQDGDQLGTVKEVGSGFFKVDAKMQVDYWLQSQFVESAESGKVVMQFTKDDLGNYKVTDPSEAAGVQTVADDQRVDSGALPENTAASTINAVENRAERGG